MVLSAVLTFLFCQQVVGSVVAMNCSVGLAQLEEALANTNRSLTEARGQRDACRKRLGMLEGKSLELEQALANITQLQEENKALKTEVAQQHRQLQDLQSSRDKLQLQNQLLQNHLQDMKRQHSGGNRLSAVSLSLLALLLPGMLLL